MSRRVPRAWLLVLALGVLALGGMVVVTMTRSPGGTDPSGLVVGDCFDVPAASDRIGDLVKRGCGEPHDGEVFHIYETTDAASSGYPADTEWETLVFPACDPLFESYTGSPVAERLDIEYRYLVPTADRWASGDRRVTCFITSPDGAPLSRSFRAAT
jgi:hypothetical protein